MTEGIHVFWKPKGVSSNGFLQQLRKETGIKKIGHAGTLDPLAEGILIVGIGKGTKLITDIAGSDKEYIATVYLGAVSDTDDEEGQKKETPVYTIPDEEK